MTEEQAKEAFRKEIQEMIQWHEDNVYWIPATPNTKDSPFGIREISKKFRSEIRISENKE